MKKSNGEKKPKRGLNFIHFRYRKRNVSNVEKKKDAHIFLEKNKEKRVSNLLFTFFEK